MSRKNETPARRSPGAWSLLCIRLATIIGISGAAGFAYNAVHDAGVKWSATAAAKPAKTDQYVTFPFAPNGSTISWPEVFALQDQGKLLLVDARYRAYWQAGNIPGSVQLNPEGAKVRFDEFYAKYPKDIPIVIYCGGPDCPFSKNLAILLMQEGYLNVRYVPGGYEEWLQLSGKVTGHEGHNH